MKIAIKRIKINETNNLELFFILLWTLFSLSLISFKRELFPSSPPRFFLFNNLILATLPLLFSLFASYFHKKPKSQKILSLYFFLFPLWLIFLPNSLYLFTDLVHLSFFQEFRFNILEPFSFIYWLDLLIFINFGLLGFYIGLVSIYIWHKILRDYSDALSRITLLSITFLLVGVGVYLGRFIRLFSWEALTNFNFINYEIQVLISYEYGLLFSLFLSLTYLFAYLSIFSSKLWKIEYKGKEEKKS